MPWKWTRVHDEDDGDVPVDVNSAVSTQYQAPQDNEQLLLHRKELKGLREDAEAAPPPFFMQKKLLAARAIRSLGMSFLVVVISVARGGS